MPAAAHLTTITAGTGKFSSSSGVLADGHRFGVFDAISGKKSRRR
jgi:hypothetical protein